MSQASRALSNLRGIVIVIVLAFHSSLAYLVSVPVQSARFDQAPYTWQAFPIVDTHRWIGFDVFCAWQDVSLMSTMFSYPDFSSHRAFYTKGAGLLSPTEFGGSVFPSCW